MNDAVSRLQETGAGTDGAIYCASLEKTAATDIAVSDRKQSHGLKSTSRPEEINVNVDDKASSGAYIRPLATDTKGEEGFRGGKFEPLETVSATITEVEAEKDTGSHGSDPRQETAPRPVDVSSVVKPLNKCETISPTSWDRKEKIFDTTSSSSTSTRASAHSDEGKDTEDMCGSLRSRKANSCIVEKVTRASQTPRPESQRIDCSWSFQTFAVDGDDIQAFPPQSVTGTRANSAEEVIATPEPEGSVHGGTSQERHGDTSKSPPNEDAPDKVDNQVKVRYPFHDKSLPIYHLYNLIGYLNVDTPLCTPGSGALLSVEKLYGTQNLQRELYSTRRSLAVFKILFFFSRQLFLAMDDRALGFSRAFAR